MKDILVLNYKDVSLRDLREEDLKDYMEWYKKKEDWQSLEMPWDTIDLDKLEGNLKDRSDNKGNFFRKRFEIDYEGRHIGWVSSYYIDGEGDKLSLGVVLAESSYWGRNIDQMALICFIRYILDRDPYRDIFIETLDDNVYMQKLSASLGFDEVVLDKYSRLVDGERYTIKRFKLTDENIYRYRL